jgi:hypothetical protein
MGKYGAKKMKSPAVPKLKTTPAVPKLKTTPAPNSEVIPSVEAAVPKLKTTPAPNSEVIPSVEATMRKGKLIRQAQAMNGAKAAKAMKIRIMK